MTRLPRSLLRTLRRLRRDERGAALAEFAVTLPLTVLLFSVVVEGGRMFWSYQSAVAGVRDATRYLSRVAPHDVCNGGSLASYTAQLETIVRETIDGSAIFPAGVTVTSVTPSLSCVSGSYRIPTISVAEVSASVSITFPFAGLMAFATGRTQGTITTAISDEQRIFGI